MLDGINEHHVVANVNVVPTDYGKKTAYPSGAPYITLSASMVIRYVLDCFKTAKDASEFVRDHMVVYFPKALHDVNYDVHFMIADLEDTYLVEFIDGSTVVTEMERPYMTNFHLNNVIVNSDGTVYTPETQDSEHDAVITNHISPYGSGLERYNIIAQNYSSANNQNGMRALLDQLTYTKAYPSAPDTAEPRWLTEFVGGKLRIDSKPNAFYDILEAADTAYRNRNRNTAKTWQTCHSIVYDLNELSCKVIFQEDGEELSISLKDED